MPYSPGDHLGPYELIAITGEGGMGVVWKARDPRLDRIVALKVSKEAFTDRFHREARAVAALNHAHICQLYDIGPNYLVMEFVEGQPLKGPLPEAKASEYAGQILDALDAAHKKGITHRDLKPANVLVTNQGIKLLDFGLAKRAASTNQEDATLTATTGQGQIAGTLPYMSPEQLQGKPVDARSDLFSFGCVLYEMLSGRRAFTGDSSASIIAAVLEREPPRLEVAPLMERLLRTCLAKDPDLRFQTAVDLKRNLVWAAEELPAAPVAVRTKSSLALWAIGLLVALAAGLAWKLWRTPAKTVTEPIAITRLTRDGRSWQPALSPDGKMLAFVSARDTDLNDSDIYIQQSGSRPIRLTDDPAIDTDPVFSADGSKILFSSARNPPGIYEVPALGGDARLVIPEASRPQPSPNGTSISYLLPDGWWYVDTLPLTKPVPISESMNILQTPVWSPDGSKLMIKKADFQIISLDGKLLQALPLAANLTRRRLTQAAVLAVMRWLPNDDLILTTAHGDATNIWRIPLRDAAEGIPTAITAGTSPSMYGVHAVANRIVFADCPTSMTLWSLPCDLKTGTVHAPLKKLLPGSVDGNHPDITPDGSQLVYCSRRNGPQAIWTMDVRTGKDRLLAQMKLQGDDYSHTVISPDGKLVAALAQDAKMSFRIVLMNATGGPEKVIHKHRARLRGFTPDSRALLLWGMPVDGEEVALLDIATGVRTQLVNRAGEVFREPRLSPDGNWLSFGRSDGTLYVAPFRGARPIPAAEWIEVGVGTHPTWSPDGNSLYFRQDSRGTMQGSRNVNLMRQPLDSGTKRPAGPATVFYRFGGILFGAGVTNPIAVARDQIILSVLEPASDIWSIDLRTN